jgi:hypothetical protein
VTALITGRVGRVSANTLGSFGCVGTCEAIVAFLSCIGRGVTLAAGPGQTVANGNIRSRTLHVIITSTLAFDFKYPSYKC